MPMPVTQLPGGEVPLTAADLERYTEGQCHALALAASAALDRQGVPHRLAALYVDPAGSVADAAVGDVDAELGDGATAANTQHVFVVRSDTGEVLDVVGWCRSLDDFMNYAYAGVLGDFCATDDPLLRYAWVDAAWVAALGDAPGWQPADLERACEAVAVAMTRANPWPEYPDPVD